MIGPSGCGKSTFIRCLNRMNDLVPGVKVGGTIRYHGVDLYGPEADPVEVRRRIGMVFQKPNPFPKSIHDNVAFAPKVLGMRGNMDERVERALRGAALWDEVKDRLERSALALSGGQQQRLCIARALAVEPEVILLDEPASALDPISTAAIEDLMHELKRDYTLVIVTHNMQQAARVADMTAFFSLEVADDDRYGDPRRVRRDREDLHPPRRQANRGLRHRPVRLAGDDARKLSRRARPARGAAPDGERLRAALAARGADGARPARRRARRRRDRVRRRRRRRYLAIEEGIQNLLARQTPVAVDLRRVLAILHDNLHLERMGDHCVTIAKLIKLTERFDGSPDLIEAFREMGSRAEEMIRVAVDSFAARDVARAETLVELDELIDRANRQAVEQVFAIADDVEARRWGLRMLLVSRSLERIGDHAVDIGEQTVYLVTGEFREYTDASRPSLAGT